MKLDKFQKAKIILGMALFGLFLMELFVPALIDNGSSWCSEDSLESLVLFFGFMFTIYAFWHYDYLIQKKDQEMIRLFEKHKEKEKELLETFQYLGKINVQFSVIKDLLVNMKNPAPRTPSNLKKSLKKFLNIICNVTGSRWAEIRIIDIEKSKCLLADRSGYGVDDNIERESVSVKKLLKVYNKNNVKFRIGDFEVFYSNTNDSKIRTFVILPVKRGENSKSEDFLRAIISQCEILFLLFESRYSQSKKLKNRKK